METINHYPVFEADQVLTNDDLNDMFDYLDEQERLTRTRLIGIGIVCGLEIQFNSGESAITITKGCGITSQGYIISEETDVTMEYYRPYVLPARVVYTPFMIMNNGQPDQQIPLLELLSKEEYKQLDDPSKAFPLSQPEGFSLDDKVVVLFLEMDPDDLKNCLSGDCDNKGINMELHVKRLLVDKKYLQNRSNENGSRYDQSIYLPDLHLRRFNVQASGLKDFSDIFNAYDQIIRDTGSGNIMNQLATALQKQYLLLKPFLSIEYPSPPFPNLKDELLKKYALLKKNLPLGIQYFYDFLDDLVKAYNELKEKCRLLISECCPDENLFPLHLKLGEATINTAGYHSLFREYFIYSPLFSKEHLLVEEFRSLFKRIIGMITDFQVPSPVISNNMLTARIRSRFMPVRITPSGYGRLPLSGRGIPYYYTPDGKPPLYQSWDFKKTRSGKANQNLSYFADQYNTSPADDPFISPLEYSIEPYNFFRVEGHIGQNYSVMLDNINDWKSKYRLPFDVIALKLGTDSSDISPDISCRFEDLESQFDVIKSELLCRLGDQICFYAGQPYISYFVILPGLLDVTLLNLAASGASTSKSSAAKKKATKEADPESEYKVMQGKLVTAVEAIDFIPETVKSGAVWQQFYSLPLSLRPGFLIGMYAKGQFLNSRPCFATIKNSKDKTNVGQVYIARIKKGDIPAYPPENVNFISDYYLKLTDLIEDVVSTVYYPHLSYFNIDNFITRLKALKDYANQIIALLKRTADKDKSALDPLLESYLRSIDQCCDLEKLKALKKEYQARLSDLQKELLFSNFINKHPGIDHKAGVPVGGTFILVYYEETKGSQTSLPAAGLAVTAAGTAPAVKDTTARASLEELKAVISAPKYALDPALTKKILDALDSREIAGTPERIYRIPDKAVVADFYLPYRCCSDCGGITYIYPAPPVEEKVSISMQPATFCNDDEKEYPVTVTPEGAKVTGKGITQNDQGQFVFKPFGLDAGDITLTGKLSDQKATVTVKIFKALDNISFKYKAKASANDVVVNFIPSVSDGSGYHWDFGDGTSSDETQPQHTYSFGEAGHIFSVRLTVQRGTCSAAGTQRIILKKTQPKVFTIKPSRFVFTDENAYPFNINPPVKKNQIVANTQDPGKVANPDKLNLEVKEDQLLLHPAMPGLKESLAAQLRYQGFTQRVIIIKPDATFTTDIKSTAGGTAPPVLTHVVSNEINITLQFKAGDTAATSYRWIINGRDGILPAVAAPPALSLAKLISQLNVSMEQGFTVELSLAYTLNNATASAVKKVKINTKILRQHLNKGAF